MFLSRLIMVLVAMHLVQASAMAQFNPYPYNFDTRPVRGLMPTADQVASPLDSIEPVTGKLNIQIPLASLPRGRGGSGFDVNLQYDSHLYDLRIHPQSGESTQKLDNTFTTGGWTYNFQNYRVEEERRVVPLDCLTRESKLMMRYRIGLPDGSQHVLHLTGWGDGPGEVLTGAPDGFYPFRLDGTVENSICPAPPPALVQRLTYFTTDGSFLKFEIDADGSDWRQKYWMLHYPDGTRVSGRDGQAELIIDPNGSAIYFANYCSDFPTCREPLHSVIFDDFERAIVIDYNAFNTGTARVDLVTSDGPDGPQSVIWTIGWELKTVGSSRFIDYVCAFEVEQYCVLNTSHWVVTSVQLPQAPAEYPPVSWNSYTFDYNDDSDPDFGYGELDLMRTPFGSVYEYHYLYETPPPLPATAQSIMSYNAVKSKKITHDGVEDTWTYTFNDSSSVVHDNQTDSDITHYFFNRSDFNDWKSGLVHTIVEPQGSVRKRVWSQNKVYGHLNYSTSLHKNNPYAAFHTTTFGDSSGVPIRTATTQQLYDKNGQLLVQLEQDWQTYILGGAEVNGTVRRTKAYTYYTQVPDANAVSDHAFAYWKPHVPLYPDPLLPRRLDAVFREQICDGLCNPNNTTTKAVTEFAYDDPFLTGNVTAEKRWNSERAASVPAAGGLNENNAQVLTRTYDAKGNLTELTGHQVHTKLTYDAMPGFPAPGPYPTKIENAFDNSTLKRTSTYGWNYAAGVLTTKTDTDNAISTTYGYDHAGRPKTFNEGLRTTETVYNDQNKTVLIKRDRAAANDGKLQSKTSYDHLGRVKLVQTSDGADLLTDTDGIKVQTQYLLWNERRLVIRSKPYRTLDGTTEWLCVQHDLLGRVTHSAMFRGANAPTSCDPSSLRTGVTTTAYDKEITMLTDPAGKTIYYHKDSLGRLVQAIEDFLVQPLPTRYVYDALNNLCRVSQYESGAGELDPLTSCTASQLTGVQHRKYGYSSLSHLLSAENPETGQTIYTYKDYGSIASRTDARGFKVDFDYDELHRLKEKNYSNDLDRTPDVTYTYHQTGAPNIGQLKSISSSAATTSYLQYDSLGRVLDFKQTIGGTDYPFIYTWWLHGAIRSVTYPSLRKMSYDVDNAGRVEKVYVPDPYSPLVPLEVYANLTSSTPPTKPYTPDGRIAWLQLGNDLWETYDYQPPGTTTTFKLGTNYNANDKLELQYNYSGTANNGNLMSHVIKQGGNEWTQQIGLEGYDAYNRLISVTETKLGGGSWNQTYEYDRFGNRWVSASSLAPDPWEPTVSTNFNTSNNRINVQNPTFDSAGNQTLYKGFNIDYDAENRSVKMTSALLGTADFSYDGEGRRVVKSWDPAGLPPALLSHYVYDAFGDLAATYSNDKDIPTGTSFPFADALGSIRAITGPKPPVGSAPLLECFDYSPFGRPLGVGNQRPEDSCYPVISQTITPRMPQRFTGKERDTETGLDYFGARYLSAAEGRFTSPDRPLVDQNPADPQSWNLYTYVRNNPLRFVDPTGEAATVTSTCTTKDELTTCEVRIHATAAFYPTAGTRQGAVQVMANQTKASVEKAWSGTFVENGVTYNVSTTVDVQVYRSEGEAMGATAQNVIAVDNESRLPGPDGFVESAEVSSRPLGYAGPDRALFSAGAGGSVIAHEFGHMLGVGHHSGNYLMSPTPGANTNTTALTSATTSDLRWALLPSLRNQMANEHVNPRLRGMPAVYQLQARSRWWFGR